MIGKREGKKEQQSRLLSREPIGLNYKSIRFMDKWGWIIVIILVGIMSVAMLSFISTSNVGLMIFSGKAIYGVVDKYSVNSSLIKGLQEKGVRPILAIGYTLGRKDIEELDEKIFTPFLKVADCDGNACVRNVYYTCKDRQIVNSERCKYGCDDKGCFECSPWKLTRDEKFTQVKGTKNKCDGNDLLSCESGHWEKLLTCPYQCVNQQLLSKQPGVQHESEDPELLREVEFKGQDMVLRLLGRPPFKYQKLTDWEGKPVYEGKCSCNFNAPKICVEDSVYECLGYKDVPYYTKIKNCAFGCEEGRCLKVESQCTTGKTKCRFGFRFVCKNERWTRTDKECSVGDFYTEEEQKKKKALQEKVFG
ncbi:TPA: hypothetical protein HA249_03225 [Candidatus Woesearchaeota archaeon]|nr:hypothetical protein [Candidatus Woesearchaeota archaeon]HII88571.1 hypothetical protein [Candidatus Woesearchaeota archaeon]